MYLGNTNLSDIADKIPRGLLDRALAEEKASLAASSDKRAHLASRVEALSLVKDELRRNILRLQEKAVGLKDRNVKAAIDRELSSTRGAIEALKAVLSELRSAPALGALSVSASATDGGGNGDGGSEASGSSRFRRVARKAWEGGVEVAKGTAASLAPLSPLQILALTTGLAVAVALAVVIVKGQDRIMELFPGIGGAAKTALVIAGVASAMIGTLWALRIMRDIWYEPKAGRTEPRPPAQRPAFAFPRTGQ